MLWAIICLGLSETWLPFVNGEISVMLDPKKIKTAPVPQVPLKMRLHRLLHFISSSLWGLMTLIADFGWPRHQATASDRQCYWYVWLLPNPFNYAEHVNAVGLLITNYDGPFWAGSCMFPTNLFQSNLMNKRSVRGSSSVTVILQSPITVQCAFQVLRWTLIIKAAAAPHSMRSYGLFLFKEVGVLSQIAL